MYHHYTTWIQIICSLLFLIVLTEAGPLSQKGSELMNLRSNLEQLRKRAFEEAEREQMKRADFDDIEELRDLHDTDKRADFDDIEEIKRDEQGKQRRADFDDIEELKSYRDIEGKRADFDDIEELQQKRADFDDIEELKNRNLEHNIEKFVRSLQMADVQDLKRYLEARAYRLDVHNRPDMYWDVEEKRKRFYPGYPVDDTEDSRRGVPADLEKRERFLGRRNPEHEFTL